MTSANQTPHALTKEALHALRKASDVVFRFHKGVCTIETSIRRYGAVRLTSEEHRSVIPVGHRLTTFSTNGSVIESAFHMNHSACVDPAWLTIANHVLRAGDELVIEWRAGSSTTEALRHHDFVGDDILLHVKRTKGRKQANLTFNIGHQICSLRNDSARMCLLSAQAREVA
jgi:hypothetical protein